MSECTRPTEAACCCIQKFLRYAYTAYFRVIQTRKMLCALHVYMQTVIGVYFQIILCTEPVTCMHVLHKDEICFTSMDAIFKAH